MKRNNREAIVEHGATIGYIDRVNSLAPFAALDVNGDQLLRFQRRSAAVAEIHRAWRNR